VKTSADVASHAGAGLLPFASIYPAILTATLVGMALPARFNWALKEIDIKKPS
jgi:hypothetical protein